MEFLRTETDKQIFHIISIIIYIICIQGVMPDTLCPDNWTAFSGSCYLFPHDHLSFHDSQRFCEHFGGYLAHVNDANENAFLKSFLSDLKESIHWIGLTDEVTEGVWRWYDNNQVANFTNWHILTSEPNGGKIQNCVYIDEAYGYEWIDAPCDLKRTPLCEKRPEDEEIIG